MQALIKKGTKASPIYGWVRFEPKGWKIVADTMRPYILTDAIRFEDIDSLTNGQTSKENYELVTITLTIQE